MASNDVCEHQNANYLRMMSERDALRAEVERLREVSAAQPYETERELAVALDEAQQQLADLRAQYVRKGVCLLCGGAVLDSGEHINPARHTAEVERILAGSGEHPGEDECEECEAIARMIYSDPSDLTGPCSRHSHDRPAPVTPDSADVREGEGDPPHLAREWAALSTQERAEVFVWFTRPLAAVGQGVTAEQRDEAILAATHEVAKQARPWPGDGLLHDVRPVEAADAAVRAALDSLGVAVRPSGQEGS